MKILAFDCTGKDIVIELYNENKKFKKVIVDKQTSESLLLSIDKLLTRHKVKVSGLTHIGVCIGPGSFTGIRVGISVAKAMARVADAKVVGFSAFELFEKYIKDKQVKNEEAVIVLPGFSDFVYAKFSGDKTGECIEISKLLEKMVNYSKLKIICVNGTRDLLGDLRGISSTEVLNLNSCDEDLLNIVKEKMSREEFTPYKEILPIYLRASQAEIQKQKAGHKNG